MASGRVAGPLLVYECDGKLVEFYQGDITAIEADAIVNPANSLMIMGGGVAGAIRRAAGSIVEEEARRRAPVPVGEAIVTSAGNLEPRIRAVIHAPTMERPAMRTTVEKVRRAARAALHAAADKGFDSVAMPALGAGVGGVPVEDAVKAILEEVLDHWENGNAKPRVVRLVAYTESEYKRFAKAADEVLPRRGCSKKG